jgi:hypothetical protein
VDEEVRAVGVRVEDQRAIAVVPEPSRVVLTALIPIVVSTAAPAAGVRNEREDRGDQSGDSPVSSHAQLP